MKLKIIILMVMANALCACSSLGKSVMLGASLGGVSGALMGEGVSSNQSSGRATGALVGAAVGGIIGYFAHKEKSDVKTTQKATEDDVPLLTRPKVRRVWVKDEIKGHRFVKGHWEYVLEENSVWSK